jgi:general secretion pathway protein F
MTRFRYRSVPPAGAAGVGEIDAADERAAISQLQAVGHYPLDIRPADDTPDAATAIPTQAIRLLPADDAALAIRQLATLAEAGVPLDAALGLTAELGAHPALADLVGRLRGHVQGGAALSTALAHEGHPFGPLAGAMVRAGEASGRLGEALGRAALWLERSRDLGTAMRNALVYPAVLMAVAAAAILLLIGFVIPRFQIMFRDMADRLPWGTRAVMAVADGLAAYGPFVALALLVAVALLRWYVGQPDGRLVWHGLLLRLPVLGHLMLKRDVERFARALGGLAGAGVALPEAVELARATLVNEAMRAATVELAGDIRRGVGPAEALARCGRFPPAVIGLVTVGQETGRLALMLDQTAELYRREVEALSARLTTLLTPVLTIGLGVVIAAIILALLLPILGLYETIL